MEELQPSKTASEDSSSTAKPSQAPPPSTNLSTDDVPADYYDSNCSTPYASAPSSPSRAFGGGFFYSAPTSPMHYVLSNSSRSSAFLASVPSDASSAGTSGSFEFEFSARFVNPIDSASPEVGAMSSADELFHNGQIRPMKLSSHLERPQVLAPLLDVDESEDNGSTAAGGGSDGRCGNEDAKDGDGGGVFLSRRELRLRDRSLRRRTRSLSPLRNTASLDWTEFVGKEDEELGHVKKILSGKADKAKEDNETPSTSMETTPSASASSSRCSSAGRSSKRWVFLKDFLRSKSEGRSSNGKFWTNISFSPTSKDRKNSGISTCISPLDTSDSESKEKGGVSSTTPPADKSKKRGKKSSQAGGGKPRNGLGKRRVQAPSPHELHYTANRAQAAEMRKKTFLPYRQGLLGCLGFSSRSYGAINGFAKALNPVSSM